MKSHTFENCAAQGDVLVSRVDEIPADAVKQEPEGGQYIVAHSETGHHHVIEAENVEYFHAANQGDFDGQVAFLRVHEPVDLRHLRSFDTHAPLHISPGLYRLNRQREYTPEGFRRATD